MPGSLKLQPAALGVAFLRFVDDGQRAVRIFETGSFEHQAVHLAMEMQKELLADGTVVVEQFRMLAGFVEPYQRVRQVEKGDSALTDDLQIGWTTEGCGFLPLRGDVAAAS